MGMTFQRNVLRNCRQEWQSVLPWSLLKWSSEEQLSLRRYKDNRMDWQPGNQIQRHRGCISELSSARECFQELTLITSYYFVLGMVSAQHTPNFQTLFRNQHSQGPPWLTAGIFFWRTRLFISMDMDVTHQHLDWESRKGASDLI